MLPERIANKIDATGPCWEWTATCDRGGYGSVHYEGSMKIAHRVVYELLVGPIPPGLQLDHLCRVRHCVNPDHLEPVTRQENMARGVTANKTHCPQGHAYDKANTYVYQGRRHCRACNRKHTLAYYHRNKEIA